MNYSTTIAIPLSQYYSFVSDVGEIVPSSMKPTADLLSNALVQLAKAHPDAYRDLTLSERRRLRVPPSDCVDMTVGRDCIDELTCLARVDPKEASLIARALMDDYFLLDKSVKAKLLSD
jgi:hypothetical protein